MTKYKKFYDLMESENKELFAAFQDIHDGYKTNRHEFSSQFHQKGQEVVDVIRSWERRLCGSMERGKHAQYSNKLAEKFWEVVKKRFSHIELVGVKSNLDT